MGEALTTRPFNVRIARQHVMQKGFQESLFAAVTCTFDRSDVVRIVLPSLSAGTISAASCCRIRIVLTVDNLGKLTSVVAMFFLGQFFVLVFSKPNQRVIVSN